MLLAARQTVSAPAARVRRDPQIKQNTFEPLTEAFSEAMADVPDRDSVIAEGVLVASLVHVTAREAGFRASGIATTALRIHLADQIALVITGARPR